MGMRREEGVSLEGGVWAGHGSEGALERPGVWVVVRLGSAFAGVRLLWLSILRAWREIDSGSSRTNY